MAEVCIIGSLSTTPNDALDFILDLLPVELIGVKVATLAAIRLRKANLWSMTSFGNSRLTYTISYQRGSRHISESHAALKASHPTLGQSSQIS